MPKRLKTQRRGKGSPVYTATLKAVVDAKYVNVNKLFDSNSDASVVRGEVVDLFTDPSKSGVVAKILYDNGEVEYNIAAEGLRLGQRVFQGAGAELEIGNVKPLGSCVEGCPVFNVENHFGDGGKLVRSSGMYATILAKEEQKVLLKLPSGRIVSLKPENRATIGIVGGGGRREKPFVKAGKKFFAMKAKHKKYPIVRGIAMNALSHPFGGANHHPGKSKSVSRHAAPGRKVGDIASKRTGRRKK